MFALPLDRCMFSCPGSYLVIGCLDKTRYSEETRGLGEGVYIRQLYGAGRRQCLKITTLRGNQTLTANCTATPGAFAMSSGDGTVTLSYADEHCIAGQGSGIGVRLEMEPDTYEYAAMLDEQHFLLNSAASKQQFLVSVSKGKAKLDAPYSEQSSLYIKLDLQPDDEDNQVCFTVQDFDRTMPTPPINVDISACTAKMKEDFNRFADRFPSLQGAYRATEIEALYVLWSCIVSPCGALSRRAVLMSNNWMPHVWTWDSVINGMALALGDPVLAKEQFFVSLDHQTEEGRLPDYVNPSEVLWNFTKPPIHGVAVLHGMLDTFTHDELTKVYDQLTKQLEYWLIAMDSDHDGIPQYNHGNDCGWDNCTPFRIGPPIEGPDLTAYIILQMHALQKVGEKLDMHGLQWKDTADELLARLLEHSYHGGRFHAYQSGTHQEYAEGDSLYNYMPLVLGHYLPQDIFCKLVDELKTEQRFLTEIGLASESTSSPCYDEDSYWRGPVWPSVMLLLVQGIADGGDSSFARELSKRFCDCIRKHGFFENFQANTGRGLRDPAHTWTAAAFLVMSLIYLS